jgi:hypothetical protein
MVALKALFTGVGLALIVPVLRFAFLAVVALFMSRPTARPGGLGASSLVSGPLLLGLFLVGSLGFLAIHYVRR